jgi:1,4-alpha-glucan branching enzyme
MEVSPLSPQFRRRQNALRLLFECLLILIASFLLGMSPASAADPLGATLHQDGTTTFRVWAPFVDSVSARINDSTAVPLSKEQGHPDPADTTWIGTVPATRAGDQYRYVIQIGSVVREFNDPRAQQLTGFDLPNGFGLAANGDQPKSVIIDPAFTSPAFTEPTFNAMVIYEIHIGTFANTFDGAVQKARLP